MGRYANFSNGRTHKFWFGVQGSGDIMSFGGEEQETDMINWMWGKEDIETILENIDTCEMGLKQLGVMYREIMDIVDKGYNNSMLTENQIKALPIVARMNLGFKILDGVRENGFLSCEAEC